MPGEALEDFARDTARQLVFRVGGSVFAARVEHVVETMRPLPVVGLPDAPAFLLGVSVIRGKATPVVDVGRLAGADRSDAAPSSARFVVVRVGERRAALAVDQVIGVLPLVLVEPLSELCGPASGALSASPADGELLLLLDLVRLVPPEGWAVVDRPGSAD